MTAMLDLRLIHDGKRWIAENGDVRAEADTLANLDLELARAFRDKGEGGGGDELYVRMTFDNGVIPQWIRQYSNHYFNRIVRLDLSRRSEEVS